MLRKEQILYVDNEIIIINKPVGMLSQKTHRTGNDVLTAVRKYFYSLGSPSKAYQVHRLDRNTTGCIIVARNKKTAAQLSKKLRKNKIKKTYRLFVYGKPNPPAGIYESMLVKVAETNHVYSWLENAPESDIPPEVRTLKNHARCARTGYHITRRFVKASECEAVLYTGRPHQIRVHFAAMGYPVIGDRKYGIDILKNSKRKLIAFSHPALHASRVEFIHPSSPSHMMIDVSAPLPDDYKELYPRLGPEKPFIMTKA